MFLPRKATINRTQLTINITQPTNQYGILLKYARIPSMNFIILKIIIRTVMINILTNQNIFQIYVKKIPYKLVLPYSIQNHSKREFKIDPKRHLNFFSQFAKWIQKWLTDWLLFNVKWTIFQMNSHDTNKITNNKLCR